MRDSDRRSVDDVDHAIIAAIGSSARHLELVARRSAGIAGAVDPVR